MTIPLFSSAQDCGTALLAGQPAVVKWTSHTTETAIYVHLGFVPSVLFIRDVAGASTFWWWNTLADATAILENTDALIAADGVTPVKNGLVPNASYYIKNGAVVTSDGTANDYVTGVLIGVAMTTNGSVMHLVAWP